MIRLEIDTRGFNRKIANLAKQIRFAASRALNDSINAGQKAIQAVLPQEFNLTQPAFIRRTIYRTPGRDFATKDRLVATVRVNPAPRRNQLAKFERGGRKVALSGRPYLALPARDLKRTKRGAVPRSLQLQRFRPFEDLPGGRARGQNRSFIVPIGGGNKLLLQRTSRTRTRALWFFTPTGVRIPSILQFRRTAEPVVRATFPGAFRKRLTEALRTAR